jgi:hypothetical protein
MAAKGVREWQWQTADLIILQYPVSPFEIEFAWHGLIEKTEPLTSETPKP